MRRGSTLIELMVTLALMAVIASVVTLALRPRTGQKPEQSAATRVADARRAALLTRHTVTVDFVENNVTHTFTAFPDGRVVADPPLAVDLLTGETARARR